MALSQFCNLQIINQLQSGLQKGVFHIAKGHLLHGKRAPFEVQKGIFYTVKGHLLKCKRASFRT